MLGCVLSYLQELVQFPKPELPPEIVAQFDKAVEKGTPLPASTPNPSLPLHMQRPLLDTTWKQRIGLAQRYVRITSPELRDNYKR